MIYLVLDTNIWLYLANGLDSQSSKFTSDQHFKLLSSLISFKVKEEATILINDIVINEWNRNKVHTQKNIEKLSKKLDTVENTFKDIQKYAKHSSSLDIVKNDYIEGIKSEIIMNQQHIVAVEDFLFNQCIKIPTSNDVKLKVHDLSIENKAPFHNSKNNVADATILLSSAEYISNLPYDEHLSAFFVSNNVNEFANQEKNDFHPDISKLLGDDTILKYVRNLSDAVKLSESIIIEIEAYNEHQAWLASVAFACTTGYCQSNKDYTSWGYLDHTVKVEYKSNDLIDPNQLNLFPEIPITKKQDKHTECGECLLCGTIHLNCPECEELIANEFDDTFSCPFCFTDFIIEPGVLVVDNTNTVL